MLGRGCANRDLADAHLVADVDLAHVGEASQQAPGTDGRDDRNVGSEHPQRGPVQVVEVDVRNESGVDPFKFGCVERHAPPEVPHPVPKDGVRQQADPVQLDQDGRVPDVEQPARDGLYTRPGISRRVRRESRDDEHC